MNKPITSRVRQATSGNRGVQEPLLDVGPAGVRGGAATSKQASPLKKSDYGPAKYGPKLDDMFDGKVGAALNSLPPMPDFKSYSAGNVVADNKAAASADTKKEANSDAKGSVSGGNSVLIDNSSKVAGTSNTIPRATDINAAASSTESKKSGFTGSTTVAGAIQRNLAARIDKAGELGRARRDARRAAKSGAGATATASVEKNEGPTELAIKSPSISVDNKGAQLKTISLGDRSTTNVSNKDYNEALMTRMNANEDALLNKALSEDDRNKPMGSESAAKMRMNSNVGMKSKSPMKKGYFKGM